MAGIDYEDGVSVQQYNYPNNDLRLYLRGKGRVRVSNPDRYQVIQICNSTIELIFPLDQTFTGEIHFDFCRAVPVDNHTGKITQTALVEMVNTDLDKLILIGDLYDLSGVNKNIRELQINCKCRVSLKLSEKTKLSLHTLVAKDADIDVNLIEDLPNLRRLSVYKLLKLDSAPVRYDLTKLDYFSGQVENNRSFLVELAPIEADIRCHFFSYEESLILRETRLETLTTDWGGAIAVYSGKRIILKEFDWRYTTLIEENLSNWEIYQFGTVRCNLFKVEPEANKRCFIFNESTVIPQKIRDMADKLFVTHCRSIDLTSSTPYFDLRLRFYDGDARNIIFDRILLILCSVSTHRFEFTTSQPLSLKQQRAILGKNKLIYSDCLAGALVERDLAKLIPPELAEIVAEMVY